MVGTSTDIQAFRYWVSSIWDTSDPVNNLPGQYNGLAGMVAGVSGMWRRLVPIPRGGFLGFRRSVCSFCWLHRLLS